MGKYILIQNIPGTLFHQTKQRKAFLGRATLQNPEVVLNDYKAKKWVLLNRPDALSFAYGIKAAYPMLEMPSNFDLDIDKVRGSFVWDIAVGTCLPLSDRAISKMQMKLGSRTDTVAWVPIEDDFQPSKSEPLDNIGTIYLSPGSASQNDIADLFCELSKLHLMLSGEGLSFSYEDSMPVEIAENA